MKNFLMIALCFCLIGCASAANQVQKPFVEPQFGMTKIELVNMIGKPDAIEIYKKSDETRVEFYIYVRKYQSSEEKVPICLINNKVVGWGKTFYQDHVSQDDIRIK